MRKGRMELELEHSCCHLAYPSMRPYINLPYCQVRLLVVLAVQALVCWVQLVASSSSMLSFSFSSATASLQTLLMCSLADK